MSDNSEAQYTFHHLAANRISQDIQEMEMILTGALSFDIQSHDHKSKAYDKEYTKKYNIT